jgi:hypothetical protein
MNMDDIIGRNTFQLILINAEGTVDMLINELLVHENCQLNLNVTDSHNKTVFFYFSSSDDKYKYCSCHCDVISGQPIYILLDAKISTSEEEPARASFRYRVHIAQSKIQLHIFIARKLKCNKSSRSRLSDFRLRKAIL